VKIPRTDSYVVSARVVLALIICKVFFARKVVDVKFSLCNSICNPKESHFHGLRALALDGVVGDAYGGGVIAIDRDWWLRMAHLIECDAKNCGLFAIEKEGAELGFGR
jgi:hypothetical protein